MPANKFYSFLRLFIRTKQSGIKLLSGKIIVLKRIHVIKVGRKIKLLNPFLAEDEDEEQEIRIVKRVEDYYPEDKFSARYELKATKQGFYFNRNCLREFFFFVLYHCKKKKCKLLVVYQWNTFKHVRTFQMELEFEIVGFEERGKPEYPGKNL